MTKNLFYLMSFGTLLLLSSCASTSRTGIVAPFARTEVDAHNIQADLDISEQNKVVGEAHQLYVMGMRVSGGKKYFEDNSTKRSVLGKKANKAQSCAMYNALEKGGYDIIADPQYRNEVHKWFFGFVKRYDVTVTGYGGNVKKLYQHK